MMGIVRYLSRHGEYSHRLIGLLPSADPGAVEMAKSAGLDVLVGPPKEAVLKEMADADLVHLQFWNSPAVYQLLQSELPPMRLLIWFHVAGDKTPQIITRHLVNFADFALGSSPYHTDLPVFVDRAKDRSEFTGMIYDSTDFARVKGVTRKPHSNFIVGYIGTVDFVKMHPRYVPMSAAIKIPEVQFIICGGGIQEQLRQQATQLGVQHRFNFLGYVEDISAVLSVLDVFGYPLCEDNYSTAELVLQEAMHAGIPPVIFPYGGASRTVVHKDRKSTRLNSSH